MSEWPRNCEFCGEPASERVRHRGRGATAKYVYMCREHARRLAPAAAVKPKAEPRVLERTEPICSDCGAEVTWITLVKKSGDGFAVSIGDNGRPKRMPVERRALRGKDPALSLVAVNAKSAQGLVLTKAIVASGDPQRWLKLGTHELHLAHHMTCSSAKRRRRQRERTAA